MKTCGIETQDSLALSLNERAYRVRYINTDSVRTLALMAQKYAQSGEQKSYALENLAFVEYQQMRFSKANVLIEKARRLTRNQLYLLALDVLTMKVAQRTGNFHDYHLAQVHANERVLRIEDEEEKLTAEELSRLRYCRSEMHIVASTYFYYLRMDSLSRAELMPVRKDVEEMQDTAQWLNYHYMLGSGGFYKGDPEDIRYHEMEDLYRVLALSKRSGHLYFEGNAMQAIAEHTGNIEMAEGAQKAFAAYKDLFQEGAALRTQAELAFGEKRYDDALRCLLDATSLIEEQHRRDSLPELQWESRIYEHLSMVYSALEEPENSQVYRLRYLDCLELMRQDIDVENRQLQMIRSQRSLYVKLLIFALLSLFVLVAFMMLMRDIKRRGKKHRESQEELLEEIKEEEASLMLKLQKEKVENIERRTKVALAASVIPLIDRLLHQSADADYIKELTEEIERLGGVLTQWIQIQSGRLNVGVTKFPLKTILDTIVLNRPTFERQGLTLEVQDTKAEVMADRVLTLFMLNTLCDNARKYTPEGGKVSIEVEEKDSYVEVSVVDTGCGFEAAENKKKGHGFGLMNCKGIIQKYRKISSRFSVCDMGHESEVGKGSRVWFRLVRVLSLVVMFCLSFQLYARDEKQMIRDSLSMHNDAAVEALARHDWAEYQRHNDECVRLHHILTQDPNLPLYAQRQELMRRLGELLIIVAAALALISLTIFTLVVRRVRRQTMFRQDLQDRLDEAHEQVSRLRYEVDRLYCQNQILDNCLSTIKHETMYYPARIRQMLGTASREQLHEVCTYYRQMYEMLTMQAKSQLQEPVCKRQNVLLSSVIDGAPDVRVQADSMLLAELLKRLGGGRFTVEEREKDVLVSTSQTNAGAVHQFAATADNFDAMVAKEILREHDAFSGHPGLRLYADNNKTYFTLWKTSR